MRAFVGVVVAALALGAALWWFAASAPSGRGEREEGSAPAAPAASAPASATLAPHASEPGAPADSPTAAEPAPAPPARSAREATSANADELARAIWVEGRVLFPEGTPADEEAFVIARGKDFADGSDHRARVETNGTFRVAFQEKTRTGYLALEARYLYLERNQRWKADEVGTPVVLEPKLGARLAGRLLVPAGTDPATVGGAVTLQRVSRSGSHSSWDDAGRREPDARLAFVYDALVPGEPTARTYDLAYEGDWVGERSTLVPEAGQTLEVELELRPGVTLTGVVRDVAGQPLARANVTAQSEKSTRGWSRSSYRHAQSGPDGTFRLGGLVAGKVELSAEARGFELVRRDLGALDEGAVLDALELVLGDGPTLTGLVRWPDGTPAEATVELVPDTGGRWGPSSDELQARSGADGRFTFAGLAAKAYRVTARAARREEIEVTSPLTGRPRTKKEVTQWRAELEDVAAGTRDVVLTLSTGLALEGLVRDDLGRPLEDFHVSAKRDGDGHFVVAFDQDLGKAFRDTDGTFRMEGFTAGAWDVVVTSKDHSEAREQVTFPAPGALRFVLPRALVVRGLVLDPAGTPVAGAQIETRGKRESPFFPGDDLEGKTDDGGRFELRHLAPGETILTASAGGFASSLPVTLQLEAGMAHEDVRLVLRRAATVVGEVRGPDGAPLVDQRVRAWGPGFNGEDATDATGRFEISGLPPGDIQMSAELAQGLRLRQQVQLAEGETVSVVLSAPRVVRLHGHVRAGGEPLADAHVYAHTVQAESTANASSSAETEADGAYELLLPGSGKYSLGVSRWNRGEDTFQWSVPLEIPPVESFAFDLVIPLGRISGRVTDARGAPLAGIEVRSWPEQHEDGAHGSAHASTDDDGRYELLVPAGRHGVRCGGDRSHGRSSDANRYAEARIGGLVVGEGGHQRNVDLRLQLGATVTGLVRTPDGAPVPQARLWREVEGRLEVGAQSDAAGRFELGSLAPGPLLLTATSAQAATPEPLRLDLAAGESRAVELTLDPATWARVSVRQAGTPVGSDLTLLDARGNRQPIYPTDKGEARLGPLVAGRYTVRAQRDGKTVERSFEIAPGAPELALELVFE